MSTVTILLPVYNGARYLGAAIRSVLEQDFTDFELHILDDWSTDASPQIAQSFADPRVRFSRNPLHLGLFAALNRGFEAADTSLVRLWAQDDVMPAGSLGRFVQFADQHPTAGMVYSDFLSIGAEGERTGSERAYAGQRARTPTLADPRTSAVLFWLYGCLPGNISTVLVRREAWAACGGFLAGLEQTPDYDLWCRISERADIGFIAEPLVELREHAGQQSRAGHRLTTTIEEERPIVLRLRERLAGLLTERELRETWTVERGRQQFHWIVRALLRGDLRSARRGLGAIRQYPWFPREALFWLVSANGRFFVPSRDALFDRCVERLRSAST